MRPRGWWPSGIYRYADKIHVANEHSISLGGRTVKGPPPWAPLPPPLGFQPGTRGRLAPYLKPRWYRGRGYGGTREGSLADAHGAVARQLRKKPADSRAVTRILIQLKG